MHRASRPRELEAFLGGGYEVGIDVLNDLDGEVLSVVVKRDIKFVDGTPGRRSRSATTARWMSPYASLGCSVNRGLWTWTHPSMGRR
jgi:hypothetical protein